MLHCRLSVAMRRMRRAYMYLVRSLFSEMKVNADEMTAVTSNTGQIALK